MTDLSQIRSPEDEREMARLASRSRSVGQSRPATVPPLALLVAISPPSLGSRVHLSLPGYQPGRKPRHEPVGLCGQLAYKDQIPVSVEWAADRQSSGIYGPWCTPCLGHLAAVLGAAPALFDLLRKVRQEAL